jgi:uncharacterized protein (TIRG00374 family)
MRRDEPQDETPRGESKKSTKTVTGTLGRFSRARLGILLLKCALAAALVGWLLRTGRLDLTALSRIQFGWLLAGVLVFRAIAILLPLARWHVLARTRDLDLRLATAIHIGLIGSFFSIVAPSGIAVDSARLFYGMRATAGSMAALLSSLVMDRLVGFAALVTLASILGVLLLVHSSAAGLADYAGYSVLLALLLALGLVAVALAGRLLLVSVSKIMARVAWRPVAMALAAFSNYRDHKAALGKAFAISCAAHLSFFTAIYLGFRSLHFAAPLLLVFSIAPLVTLSWMIPTTPLGIGVVDSAAEISYAAAGVEGGAEVMLVMRGTALLIYLMAGLAYLIPVSEPEPRPGG